MSTPRPPRARRSLELRRQIVEETLAPGASVSLIARAHNVNANQVFTWRRRYQQGLLGNPPATLLPVRLSAEAPCRSSATSLIYLDLPRAHLRIEGPADPLTLRTLLACLLP